MRGGLLGRNILHCSWRSRANAISSCRVITGEWAVAKLHGAWHVFRAAEVPEGAKNVVLVHGERRF